MTFPWTILGILYIAALVILSIKVIMDTRSSPKAVSYVLLIFILPVLGASIYLIFGRNIKKKTLYSKKLGRDSEQTIILSKAFENYKKLKELEFDENYAEFSGVAEILFWEKKSILTWRNNIKLYKNGEEKFPDLLDALRKAKNHIHIQYYIYEDDDIGKEISDLLCQKAREGVKVRFIYDDFGSRKIRKTLVKDMLAAGVEAFPFYQVIFTLLADRLNYRNHRKIVVIDGDTGFVGGINVSDKYINNGKSDLYWRDTHIRIRGEAVWTLQHVFLCDWNFAANHELGFAPEFFKPAFELEGTARKWVQVVASGPDSTVPSILYGYLGAINSAQKYVYLTTPYFIPGQAFLNALHMAALRGVDVRLLVPGISDSFITNAASNSFYDELLDMGVKVYLYQKGFVHAKTAVIDGTFVSIGTANLDIRSFDFNFEVNAMIYDREMAEKLTNMFEDDLKNADQVISENWRKRPLKTRFFERIVRLISPLM